MSGRPSGMEGRLPRLLLAHPSGSRAELHLQGAHVTSWVPAGGVETLFLSRAAVFRPGAAIRGGIPVIFPQFAGLGPLPKHGFARTLPWRSVGANAAPACATLELRDTPESRSLWPFAFLARLSVDLGDRTLAVRLSIANRDSHPFSFTAALHTYLRVADVRATTVEGLHGVAYRSALEGIDRHPDPDLRLAFPGEVDRVYFGAPRELRVHDAAAARTIGVGATGFDDVVVWNPGENRAAALPDMLADEYREMICVEAAQVGEPVHLAPGGEWSGEQRLEA